MYVRIILGERLCIAMGFDFWLWLGEYCLLVFLLLLRLLENVIGRLVNLV